MSSWPTLVPLTDEARRALNGRDEIEINRLPFRIGRESRLVMKGGELMYMERRKGKATPNNELYLHDIGELLNISREHLQIDSDGGDGFVVVDRGSACGTHVDGRAIGGRDRRGSAPLVNGSEITIGLSDSPFRFTVKHLERLAKPGI